MSDLVLNLEGGKVVILGRDIARNQGWEGKTHGPSPVLRTLLSILFLPVQGLGSSSPLSMAQRLFLVEPLKEAFVKFLSADHDCTRAQP